MEVWFRSFSFLFMGETAVGSSSRSSSKRVYIFQLCKIFTQSLKNSPQKINISPGSPVDQTSRMVFRMIHIKDSRSYQWAKFGVWTSWVSLTSLSTHSANLEAYSSPCSVSTESPPPEQESRSQRGGRNHKMSKWYPQNSKMKRFPKHKQVVKGLGYVFRGLDPEFS